MAASAPPNLPSIDQTVELWFSGYDEYYAGRVESLQPPDYFTVVLDDGSSWPVDRVNNIWKYPNDSTPLKGAADPLTSSKDEPKLDADANTDDPTDNNPGASSQPSNDPTAIGSETRAAAVDSKHGIDVDPGDDATHGKEAEEDPNTDKPSGGAEGPTMPKADSAPQKRRTAGRALRKSTGPGSRPTSSAATVGAREPSGDEGSSSQTRGSGKRRGRPPGKSGGGDGEAVGARRSLRKKDSGGAEEEGGEGEAVATRVTRRTRQTTGKRGLDEMEVDEEIVVEQDTGIKRRKDANDGAELKVMERVLEKSVMVANGTGVAVDKLMGGGNELEGEGEERLSTQAVTAIAVDAALASAKAVLKPLSDKMRKLSEEMAGIQKEVKEVYENMLTRGSRQRGVGKPLGAEVSQAALDSLLLDLSETIGGGEARIRAYEQMSDMELESFRKALQENAKALSELDRLLGDTRKEKGKESAKGLTRRARRL